MYCLNLNIFPTFLNHVKEINAFSRRTTWFTKWSCQSYNRFNLKFGTHDTFFLHDARKTNPLHDPNMPKRKNKITNEGKPKSLRVRKKKRKSWTGGIRVRDSCQERWMFYGGCYDAKVGEVKFVHQLNISSRHKGGKLPTEVLLVFFFRNHKTQHWDVKQKKIKFQTIIWLSVHPWSWKSWL